MRKLLHVNSRGQISLGKLAQHNMYMATTDDKGAIILIPVDVIPVKKEHSD